MWIFFYFSLEFYRPHVKQHITHTMYSPCEKFSIWIYSRTRARDTANKNTPSLVNGSKPTKNHHAVHFGRLCCVDWSNAATTATAMMMTTTTDNSIQEWYETLHTTTVYCKSKRCSRASFAHMCVYACMFIWAREKENKKQTSRTYCSREFVVLLHI